MLQDLKTVFHLSIVPQGHLLREALSVPLPGSPGDACIAEQALPVPP
jgi:hypothetical protein